jgi:hypothetical protein
MEYDLPYWHSANQPLCLRYEAPAHELKDREAEKGTLVSVKRWKTVCHTFTRGIIDRMLTVERIVSCFKKNLPKLTDKYNLVVLLEHKAQCPLGIVPHYDQ